MEQQELQEEKATLKFYMMYSYFTNKKTGLISLNIRWSEHWERLDRTTEIPANLTTLFNIPMTSHDRVATVLWAVATMFNSTKKTYKEATSVVFHQTGNPTASATWSELTM